MKKVCATGPGIGQARGLDEHVVEAIAPLAQLVEHADQVAAHRAADAAVGGLEDLLLGADHQLVIDRHLAELILDHGDALAVLLREDPVEQRGLARAEEPGQHRDRDAPSIGAHPPRRARSLCSSRAAPGRRSRFSSSHQPARVVQGAANPAAARAAKAAAASPMHLHARARAVGISACRCRAVPRTWSRPRRSRGARPRPAPRAAAASRRR